MATLPTIGDIAAFQRMYSVLSKRGPLTSPTVSLPSLSQINFPDSTLGGTVENPFVITGSGASAQSPLGSFPDTIDNIIGSGQELFNQSLFNQGQQIGMTAQALDPIIDKNIARTREGIIFADNRDPARQQQINKAKEADAKLKEAQATAQAAANQFGALKLDTMNLA